MKSINPATGDVLWEGEDASVSDVEAAVAKARSAFPAWSHKSFAARQEIAEAYRDVLEAKKEHMAETIARETGKVLWDARAEVGAMIGKIAISVKAFHERTGTHESETNGIKNVLRHRPHGVLGVFGPYNFPGHLPNGHIVPALLAGNTIVFKPSNLTPLVAHEMLKCWQEAGLPEGVLNLVCGETGTGKALAGHPDIDGLCFTGSSEVGAVIHKQYGGQTDKLLALEMGGNNPLVVWDVEDKKAAAYNTIQSAFITSGQRCTCARRLIVQAGKEGDVFIEALVEMAGNIRVGAYNDEPQPFMGPLVSNIEADKVISKQDNLVKEGGSILLEAKRLRDDLPFISPGIVDVTQIARRKDEECFGPLLQVIRVPDFDGAIVEANNTRYGLSAGIFCDDRALYERFLRDIRAGLVNWNRQTTGASSAAPFGGIGISGNHRPSAYYAADYCAYPVASVESDKVSIPENLSPGLEV